MNSVRLGGSVATDVTVRHYDDRRRATFLLRVERAEGRGVDFVPVVAWNAIADGCEQLGKGDRAAVAGEVRSRRWQDARASAAARSRSWRRACRRPRARRRRGPPPRIASNGRPGRDRRVRERVARGRRNGRSSRLRASRSSARTRCRGSSAASPPRASSSSARPAAGAQLVLVHHGLFWRNEPLVVDTRLRGRLEALFAADMSLVAYHLALDAHPELGNNARLRGELGVEREGPFGGLGLGGTPRRAPIALDEFVARVAASSSVSRSSSPADRARSSASPSSTGGGGLRPDPGRARGLRRADHR